MTVGISLTILASTIPPLSHGYTVLYMYEMCALITQDFGTGLCESIRPYRTIRDINF